MAGFSVLLESGDDVLLESGDLLLLELEAAARAGSGYTAAQARQRQERIDRIRHQAQLAREDDELMVLI